MRVGQIEKKIFSSWEKVYFVSTWVFFVGI